MLLRLSCDSRLSMAMLLALQLGGPMWCFAPEERHALACWTGGLHPKPKLVCNKMLASEWVAWATPGACRATESCASKGRCCAAAQRRRGLAEGTVSRPLSYPAPPTLTRGRYWPLCADAEARRSCRWDHAQVSARCLTRPVAACGG